MSRVDLSNVNMNLLVALDALLIEKGVTGAARRAHVTPSAMSHALSQLRELLRDELLVRAGRGMSLTPRAQELSQPLHRLLVEAQGILQDGGAFEPGRARRHFVVAAPDFLATLLLPELLAVLRKEAPGVTLEIVPSSRRGNAWMLESGEIDLALGAVVDDAPGIRRRDLCTEGFLCAARKKHPTIRGSLSLDQYARAEHAMITLGDDNRPTWADEQLAKLGRQRRVVLRMRYFMAAPLLVAKSDLLITAPGMLIRYFANLLPLQILTPPFALPTYPEEMYWHERFDRDPAHAWLRERFHAIARGLGTGTEPERRRYR